MLSTAAEIRAEIGAVWCPVCQVETLPHDRHGSCMFCDKVLVDAEGRQIYQPPTGDEGREALERMDAGEPQQPVEEPAGEPSEPLDPPAAAPPARSGGSPARTWSRKKKTRAELLQAIRDYAAEHGHPPQTKDCAGGAMPSAASLKREFGSFANAIETAGFSRPTRGQRYASAPRVGTVQAPKPPPASIAPLEPETAEPPGGASTASPRAGLLLILQGLHELVDHYWPEHTGD